MSTRCLCELNVRRRAHLPVRPVVSALEAAEERDGAVQGRQLHHAHGAEAVVPQGTGQGIVLQPCAPKPITVSAGS